MVAWMYKHDVANTLNVDEHFHISLIYGSLAPLSVLL